MNIHLRQPYRIIPIREKRYDAHYQIPSAKVVVIPLKALGTEVLCDVRWEDDNGELQVIHNLMFQNENLVPLNAMVHQSQYNLWSHYYNQSEVKTEGK